VNDRPGPSASSGRDGPGRGDRPPQRTPVSAATIPLLFAGIVVGFLVGYFLLGWGAIVVGVVVLGAISLSLTRRVPGDAVGAGVGGLLLGYLGVILLALFRGVL
jgi:small-conductance mechanosensitive channel